jgi:hypothetical protein
MSYLCPSLSALSWCVGVHCFKGDTETRRNPSIILIIESYRTLRIHQGLPKASTGLYTDADERKHRDTYATMER